MLIAVVSGLLEQSWHQACLEVELGRDLDRRCNLVRTRLGVVELLEGDKGHFVQWRPTWGERTGRTCQPTPQHCLEKPTDRGDRTHRQPVNNEVRVKLSDRPKFQLPLLNEIEI